MSLTSVFAGFTGTAQDRHSYIEIPSVDTDAVPMKSDVSSANNAGTIVVGNSVGSRFP